jgi:glycosyltransferase involved in cell wall biosynthesis
MLRDKGVAEFTEAARRLKAQGLQARFALVGDVDPENPASIPVAQLEAWTAEGHVEWWGFRSDMASVFAQAHVVCLPSYREGLPKALLEAACSGRPIVTTDVPGCHDVVRHEVNGLLVPARDAVSLADALARLLADPGARARMGAQGREIVLAEFQIDKVVEQTLNLYRELCAA